MSVRRSSYSFARFLGDVGAVASGKPSKVAKRAANKVIGRKIVSKMWLR